MAETRARGGARAALDVVALVITTIARIVALIIVLAILFVVLEANPDNAIVSFVLDFGDFLVGPFDELFTPKNPKLEVAINYGIAALVYLVIAGVIAGLLRR